MEQTPMMLTDWISAISTLILVLITGYYARVTNGILSQSKEEHEANLRPYMIIHPYIEQGNPTIFLKIANQGKSGAENLKITVKEDFFAWGNKDKNIKDLSIFRNTVPFFPPGHEISFYLIMGFKLFDPKADSNITPKQLNFNVKYSYKNKSYDEHIVVDLDYLEGSALNRTLVQTKLEEICDAVQKAVRTIPLITKLPSKDI